jgi:hypothetical protein
MRQKRTEFSQAEQKEKKPHRTVLICLTQITILAAKPHWR